VDEDRYGNTGFDETILRNNQPGSFVMNFSVRTLGGVQNA